MQTNDKRFNDIEFIKEIIPENETSFLSAKSEIRKLLASEKAKNEIFEILEELNSTPINKPITLAQLLARAEINYEDANRFGYESSFDKKHIIALEIQLKYAEFINKLQRRIQHVNELDSMILKENIKFFSVVGLDSKIQNQLNELHPHSIGQISRIKGFKTSDLAILIHHYKQGVIS